MLIVVPDRRAVRKQLAIPDSALVGIYCGKFGDIYYKEKAFEILLRAQQFFGENFRLVILTPQDKDTIRQQLIEASFEVSKMYIDLVSHHKVPQYLSAADFAFSMVRPSHVRKYCSPIKTGEYWANGLPVLSAHDIGDDSKIIDESNGGSLFRDDLSDLEGAFEKIQGIVGRIRPDPGIVDLAIKYRNFKDLPALYNRILGSL